ncbi:Gfo/Idh/MocA family oxidoreductase [Planktomarina sp.]|nr:Gfo/Idh/MocA family oxidoreductase [Planktomarina sp.]
MNILIIGAGPMADAYAKVLASLNINFEGICRSATKAEMFSEKHKARCSHGGLSKIFLSEGTFTHVIVAVSVESLVGVTRILLEAGIEDILIEKPAALFQSEIKGLTHICKNTTRNVFIAYNRRYLSSVQKLRSMAQQDGGLTSISFDFTEWADRIAALDHTTRVKERWALANSTHVIDLAFFLVGAPEHIACFKAGTLDWHNTASRFSGAGVSVSGVNFSYRADWDAPGRWSIVAYSKNIKYELCPLEKLRITKRNELLSEEVILDETLDISYKPGLYLQVQSFLGYGKKDDLCTLKEHQALFPYYLEIAGYDPAES